MPRIGVTITIDLNSGLPYILAKLTYKEGQTGEWETELFVWELRVKEERERQAEREREREREREEREREGERERERERG